MNQGHPFMKRSIRLAGVLAACCVALSNGALADTIENIVTTRTLRAATNPDFPPYGFTSNDQRLVGYDTEVAALIAKDLGVKLELIPATAPNRIPYLQTKKVDLIVASLGMSAERKLVVDFSAPYGAFFSGIYGPTDLPIKKPEDLAGKTIAVVRGTPPDIELSKIAPPGLQIVRYDDNNILATSYVTRQVQLISAGSNIPDLIAEKGNAKPELKIAFKSIPIGIGIIKGDARTKEKIDAILRQLKDGGELDALSRKWFGQPFPEFD
jgi:polar amino acid transport system substrate-binding protein